MVKGESPRAIKAELRDLTHFTLHETGMPETPHNLTNAAIHTESLQANNFNRKTMTDQDILSPSSNLLQRIGDEYYSERVAVMPSKNAHNSGTTTAGMDKSPDQLKVNKWDGPSVRNTIDDAIRKLFNEKYDTWTERHTLADGRLIISTIAVAFAAAALIYDYYESFPKSKPVLATCSITYFILMGILQLYQWYIEKGTFIKAYDDKYTLEAEYIQESRTGYIKVLKSIGAFIDEEGVIVLPILEKELAHIISSHCNSGNGVMPNNVQRVINGDHQNVASTSGTTNTHTSNSGAANVDAEYGISYVKAIFVVAESVGIAGLSDVCASQIAVQTTYAIKMVIEQAKKFAVHGRRKRVIAEDIDSALTISGYPPLFGFTVKEGLPFRFAGSLGRDLFVTDDRDVEITPIINAPAAKLPLDTNIKCIIYTILCQYHDVSIILPSLSLPLSMHSHWLVIDGVQPAVPENPAPVIQTEAPVIVAAEKTALDTGLSILSKAHRGLRQTEQVQIKTTSTHALSVEQQVFFKEITEAIMGSDDTRRTEALYSLQTDAGLQQLLPRFSVAIVEGVRCNIVQHNLAILIYLMRMIQSLANNPALSLERCLHELLPSVLSCILSRQLCARPETDNHWALREFSSRLLATICRSYNIGHLRSRVTQVLAQVWRDENCTLAALYGSLYALNELGVDTVHSVVIPRAAQLHNDLRRVMSDKPSTVDKLAAEKLQNFVVKVLVHFVKTQKPSGLKEVADYQNMFGGFGEAVHKTVTSEHASAVSVNASTSNNSVHSTVLHRSGSDRRPAVSAQQQQRLMIGTKQPVTSLSNSPLYVVRPQSSPVPVRNSTQQPYVNIVSSGRLQQSTPVLSRPAQQNTYYVSGGTNSPTNSYVVRPSGYKKMIVTSQRGTSSSANDSFRNS
ncbi:Transcription initiation factor TFIID subunit 6 [Dirofilaria immitis]|nr:Transcription initiation factor TFIID subunit 6 [Dirofilaria immitis]